MEGGHTTRIRGYPHEVGDGKDCSYQHSGPNGSSEKKKVP